MHPCSNEKLFLLSKPTFSIPLQLGRLLYEIFLLVTTLNQLSHLTKFSFQPLSTQACLMIMQDNPNHLLMCLPNIIAMVGQRFPVPPLCQGHDILSHSQLFLSLTILSRTYYSQGSLPMLQLLSLAIATIEPLTRRSSQNVQCYMPTNLLLPQPFNQFNHASIY